MRKLALDVSAGRRLGGSIYARSTIARGAFAAKVVHTFRIQAPYENARDLTFRDLQSTLDTLVFGGYTNVAVATAQQDIRDAGTGHINIREWMKAEWAQLARQLTDTEPAQWKNIWWYNIRRAYGRLAEADLLLTTCTYDLSLIHI